MGILDLMLGRTGPGEQGVEGQSYTLPKDSHDFVYPVAVRKRELEAFDALLEADADAPVIDGDTEKLQETLDSVFEEADVDAEELAERNRKPRVETERIVDSWSERVENDLGVVYARPDTLPTLSSFVKRCKQRADDPDDGFELPESFPEVLALLGRLEEVTDDQYRAVVHTDLLPDRTA
ncbi:hypothetical protein [Halopiger goleimassiliensis]|uniref:hypothetical protein n=1 Tax=Halopiger goleimassiliensis TaxID=1293048 RepID=UPI000677E1AD|nr:hypothetical protein [Halopiger goleimassiliensis]